MLARTEYTTKKLTKVGEIKAETYYKALDIIKSEMPFPRKDIVVTTRGLNHIGFYRPNGGRDINDKLFMFRYAGNDLWALYL